MALKVKKKAVKEQPVVKEEKKTTNKEQSRGRVVDQPKRDEALDKQIEENTNVVKKSSGEETVLKSGTPNDHFNKHQANVVGLSKGITKNMDNYESLRVDCWVSVQVKPNEDPNAILNTISDAIDERLELEVSKVLGE